MPPALSLHLVESLAQCGRDAWNALNPDKRPFLSYDFLYGLEKHACVGPHYGWLPSYLLLKRRQELVAAMPMYGKSNSYGEFVFDYEWAEAWRSQGLDYYPKLVSCVPYTPVAGVRLLARTAAHRHALIDGALKAAAQNYSGMHWLFFTEAALRDDRRLIRRLGYQYHWRNASYQRFSDFLGALTAKRRKNILRERRKVREQGIDCRVAHGGEVDSGLWSDISALYRNTFDRKWGLPTLNEGFFRELARQLPQQLVVFLAWLNNQLIACALCLRDHEALYGRYWGCAATYDCLHFELCYYLGIDYCIRHRLKRFEPGAQGEYKITRGFLPSPTWSAHWINCPFLAPAVSDFCRREEALMRQRAAGLLRLSPYRAGAAPPDQPASSHD